MRPLYISIVITLRISLASDLIIRVRKLKVEKVDHFTPHSVVVSIGVAVLPLHINFLRNLNLNISFNTLPKQSVKITSKLDSNPFSVKLCIKSIRYKMLLMPESKVEYESNE